MPKEISRRDFTTGTLFTGTLLVGGLPLMSCSSTAGTSRSPNAGEHSGGLALSETEWITIEAITGRIIPTDHEGGAIEAGCVNFIDRGIVAESEDMKPIFSSGVAGINVVATKRHGKPFARLESDSQDGILRDLEKNAAGEWPSEYGDAADFFEIVRAQTVIGFLANPGYGGNRDYVGWKVVGYPGPRHHRGGYTPAQMIGKEPIVAIWE